MSKESIGSSFEDFLKEDGIYEEVTSHAAKRVIASQLWQAMKARKISRNEMAKRMKTSRTQVARLLIPTTTAYNWIPFRKRLRSWENEST